MIDKEKEETIINKILKHKKTFKMMKHLNAVVLLNYISGSFSFCPYKCICDDESLETSCIETNLEVRIF